MPSSKNSLLNMYYWVYFRMFLKVLILISIALNYKTSGKEPLVFHEVPISDLPKYQQFKWNKPTFKSLNDFLYVMNKRKIEHCFLGQVVGPLSFLCKMKNKRRCFNEKKKHVKTINTNVKLHQHVNTNHELYNMIIKADRILY